MKSLHFGHWNSICYGGVESPSVARRVLSGGTNGNAANIDGAPLAESKRRDTRSRSLQRLFGYPQNLRKSAIS